MKVVNMGNIADAFKFDDLPATGIVIEATPKELKLLPNLAYKDVMISEHVSNAAAMREALIDACYAMFNFLKTQNGGYEEMAEALDKAKAVLSAHPSNCDVGTAEEQDARHSKWCRKYGIDRDMEVACAYQDMSCTLCALRWAQMPYEEGGEK